MSTIIAECYIEELNSWSEQISFYQKQISSLKYKLFQVAKQQVFLKDSAMIEQLHIAIIHFCDAFYEIDQSIQEQIFQLDTHYIIDDFILNEVIEQKQQTIRFEMFIIEHVFLSHQYRLYEYVFKLLKKLSLYKKEHYSSIIRI